MPSRIADEERLRLDFMPYDLRSVLRYGIALAGDVSTADQRRELREARRRVKGERKRAVDESVVFEAHAGARRGSGEEDPRS